LSNVACLVTESLGVVKIALGVSALTTVCTRLLHFFRVSSPDHPQRDLRPNPLLRRGHPLLGRHPPQARHRPPPVPPWGWRQGGADAGLNSARAVSAHHGMHAVIAIIFGCLLRTIPNGIFDLILATMGSAPRSVFAAALTQVLTVVLPPSFRYRTPSHWRALHLAVQGFKWMSSSLENHSTHPGSRAVKNRRWP
jgi:hypothetical protein